MGMHHYSSHIPHEWLIKQQLEEVLWLKLNVQEVRDV